MIADDHEFLDRAMKAYDNPSCITVEEFNRDLYAIITIKKTLKKYHKRDLVNVRRLVNYFVVFYNCFGSASTDLLFYKIDDPEHRAIMIPIMAYLGWLPSEISIDGINTHIVQDLMEL